jgi:hypothetical protein
MSLCIIVGGPGWRSRYSDSLRSNPSWGGGRFFAAVQTGPGAHPASYTIGTGSLSRGESGRGVVDHPPPSSVRVKERVELYLYSPSGTSWPVLGRTLPVHLCIVVA